MKAVHVFLGADLRCGHDGLFSMAMKAKVDVRTMAPGTVVLFFNEKKTKIKAISPNGVLSYAKFDQGIRPSSLDAFPDASHPGETMMIPYSVRRRLNEVLGVKEMLKAA